MAGVLTRPDQAVAVARLAEEMRGLLAAAVDALEVAAALEARGIGDAAARAYGCADVFELADRLYRSTLRRPPLTRAGAGPWRSGEPLWRRGGRHVLRGALFGLPGTGYAAAGPLLGGRAAGLLLTLSLVVCWGLGQGVAALAYSRPDPAATRRVLRRGLPAGLSAMALFCLLLGRALGADPAAVALACAQSLYLLAATAVLVTGAEFLLLAALLPGAAATLTGASGALLLGGWAATGLAVTALACVRVRGGAAAGADRSALRAAVPHALFGALSGGLLTFAIIAAHAGQGTPPRAMSAAIAALSVSMGAAEWLLHLYRARGHELLQSTRGLKEFASGSRLLLADVVARFLAVLAVLLAAASALTEPSRGQTGTSLWALLTGGALVVALLLQSCGLTSVPLACCAGALAAQAALPPLAGADPSLVRLYGAAALFTVLLAYAVAVLGQATAHR